MSRSRSPRRPLVDLLLAGVGALGLTAGSAGGAEGPWTSLDPEVAAAHLLDRFAFGPRRGEVEQVLAVGLERWFERQLAGVPDRELEAALTASRPLGLSAAELLATYTPLPLVLARAREAGVIPAEVDPSAVADRERYRAAMLDFVLAEGIRPEGELLAALYGQKLVRGVGSENPLREVLVDLWSEHFTVSLADPEARVLVLAYERDAIRPHVLGRFRDLLGATARHPAMLLYLDNARSTAAEGTTTLLEWERARLRSGIAGRLGGRPGGFGGALGMRTGVPSRDLTSAPRGDARRPRGLNENYARELLELHTLGVDGGYTQADVVAVARAFTGWSVLPPGRLDAVEEAIDRARRAGVRGVVRDGLFVFRPDLHDAEAKVVLGRRLPAGRGIEDGEAVLDLLARHPATARRVATRLAQRFVADQPPETLVARLAGVFLATDGDLTAVMRTLFVAPELWAPAVVRQKIKTPFELVASSLRALGGGLADPMGVAAWLERMGQPLYTAPAPAGYAEEAAAWVSAGALLERMSFGLALAAGEIAGTEVDLVTAVGAPSSSAAETLTTVLERLLPGRPHEESRRALEPQLQGEDVGLARIVGLVLGSPEMQRQ